MPAKILEVPEFNKKEVEKISLDRVKKAIDDGEIEVGGGGTKLYRHELASSSVSNTTIIIISTIHEELDIKYENGNYAIHGESIQDFFSKQIQISLLQVGNYGYYLKASGGGGAPLILNGVSLNGSEVSVMTISGFQTGNNEATITDTVTEL